MVFFNDGNPLECPAEGNRSGGEGDRAPSREYKVSTQNMTPEHLGGEQRESNRLAKKRLASQRGRNMIQKKESPDGCPARGPGDDHSWNDHD